MTTDWMGRVTVSMEQSIGFLVAEEGFKYAVAGHRYTEREKSAGQQFCVDGDVGRGLEEGGCAETAEAV